MKPTGQGGRGTVFRASSVQARGLLAIVMLLVLLASVAVLAVWRVQGDQNTRKTLEQRANVVAALDDARAHTFLMATHMAAAIFSDESTPLQDLYRGAEIVIDEDLDSARAGLVAMGETTEVAALDRVEEQMDQLMQDADVIALVTSLDTSTRMELARQYYPQIWPRVETMMADLDQLARAQEADLRAERATADSTVNTTLALLIGVSTFAFLAGAAALVAPLLSVVRPLAALRTSARAVASGDLEVRARVFGPEEVASLAQDFNEMVAQRKRAEEALRDSEERLRTVITNAPLILFAIDREGVFTLSEGKGLDALGLQPGEVVGRSVLEVYGHIPDVIESLNRALAGETVTTTVELADVAFEARYTPLRDGDGEITGGIGIAADITERKRAEEALREGEAKYRHIFENVQDIFYRTDAQGIISEISPSVERWGYTREELIGTQVLDVYENPEQRSYLLKTLMEKGEVTDYEVRLKAADSQVVDASVGSHVLRDPDGTFIGVEGSLRDISERKRAEEALREQMRRDPLTGVLNHAAIVDELRSLVSGHDNGTPCTVAMTDVDDLKAINDTFGHQVGDNVLVAVAHSLSREGAIVGRYGGDEFVALLPGAQRDTAERYRQEVLDELAELAMRDPQSGANVPVVVSIGLATYPTEAGRIEELIDLADSGMYTAKRQRPVRAASMTASRPPTDDRATKMVGEIVPLLTSVGNPDDKLRLVAHRLSVAAGYDAVNFALFKPDKAPPAMNTFGPVPEELLVKWNHEQLQPEQEQHPIRLLVAQGRPLIIDDPQQDQRLTDTERDLIRAAGLRSALVAPMLWQSELIGMLSVASKEEAAFTPGDAQFLMAIATQVTAIVRMATLVEELHSASGRIEQAHSETVMLLAAAAEAHDRTTGHHLQNVRTISQALAHELGYGEKDIKALGLAAVLHDIGKIRVPDSVLANTGRLTDKEWELMKQHTVWGGEFLRDRPGFQLAATIARSHHERWDGGGYPDGLSGTDIPKPAAIVAVADSFDAITSDRPYRPRRPIAAALQEITACSGQQFSPEAVEALTHLHKRRKLTRLHLPADEKAA